MRRAGLVAAAIAMAVATGCSGTPGDLSASAEKVLVPKVQRVRETAANGTYAQLVTQIRQLKALVVKENKDGQVSDSRANAIIDAADTLLTDARPTPTPTPTPSQTPTPTPSSTPTPTPSATPSVTPSSSQSPTPASTISIGGIAPH